MTNGEAVKNLCTAMANTFHPDGGACAVAMLNLGIDPEAEAAPLDATLFRCAVSLLLGYVEASRSEGGMSVSVRTEAVKDSIRRYAKQYGVDEAEALDGFSREISDGSFMW